MTTKTTRKFPRRIGLIAAALVGAVGLAGIAQAGWGHRGHGHGMMRGLMRIVDNLDLTEQQELELVRMRRAAREEGKAMRDEMRTDMTALVELLKTENPDKEAVHARIDAMTARATERAHAMADRVLEFQAKLSPEQKEKLSAGLSKAQERMEKRRKRWESGGPESPEVE